METLSLAERIEDYARKTGLRPATICSYAFGNARVYERELRRIARNNEYAVRLDRFIERNEGGAT